MHPIHDADVLLLLAITLSAKRKPAALAEVIAALELLHDAIPTDAKLSDAFHRLATHGLIVELAGAYTLTSAAQKIMATQPKRGAMGEHIMHLKEKLANYTPADNHYAAILISPADLASAISTHTSAQRVTKNLPKPIAQETTHNQRTDTSRRPSPRPRPRS